MQIFLRSIHTILNNFKIKQKLRIFYICCVLFPLILTDSIILSILLREEKAERLYTMENIAAAVQNDLVHAVGEIVLKTNKIFINSRMDIFLETFYPSELVFYESYYEFIHNSFFDIGFGADGARIIFYTDNETIVNGSYLHRLDSAREEEWYDSFIAAGRDEMLIYYYSQARNIAPVRRISFVKKLDYFKSSEREKLVKYDFDYNNLARMITDMKYAYSVYVCAGDKILLSNVRNSAYGQDFETLTGQEEIGYEKKINLNGQPLRILILNPETTILTRLRGNLPLISFLVAMNILLPLLLMQIINQSFTGRLRELSDVFSITEDDSLALIETVRGKDEIGLLMSNYNSMVLKFREMIKTIYQDRLEKQEMDIARKNAELLALHSQINPHFIFNVLESIRMHSVIRGEGKTAVMIEKLAMLERQNVQWSSDRVSVREEISFTRAYLELQKYRFDERLSYEIYLEAGCEEFYLPKLTLVTFVENACVHGVESKAAPSWVYVRVYCKAGWLYLEVEDTGVGIDEALAAEIMEKILNSSMAALMDTTHVGIINACLRLKMLTGGKVVFELESEKGVGTSMVIKLPIDEAERRGGYYAAGTDS